MTHLKTALERALPIVAAAYGEQFGVRVVLSGSDACTDGQTIVLPMLDNMSEMKDVLFGYLSHEAAHIRESSFDTFQYCRSSIEKDMTNLIEDIRIERAIQDAFPGTQFTLEAMEEYIHSRGWTPVPSSEENEASQLFRYLYHRLYGEFLSREVYKPLISESLKVVKPTFPRGFFVRLDGLLGKYMTNLESSNDSLKVARAILKALEDAEAEERQPGNGGDSSQENPNPSSDDSSSGGSCPTSGDGGPSSEEGTPSGADTQGTSDPSDGSGQHQSFSANQGSGESDQEEPSDGSNDSGASAYERVVAEQDLPRSPGDQLREALSSQARDDQSGKHFVIDASVGSNSTGSGDASELKEGILTSSAIRSRLLGLLQSQTRQSQRLHSRGRRVDGRRLCRLAAGDPRVFIQRDEHRRPHTSVHVLLDCSGSMSHQQEIANQATVSLSLAISTIPKCDIAVSMFPGQGGAVSPMIQRGQPVRSNLGRFVVNSSGGTPLAEAMLYAARELSASHKDRQVLIVITDGRPNDGQAVEYLNGLIKGHIDAYAIGIGSNAVKSYFENWCVISDVKELQSALFNIAGNVLDIAI